jgi:hypothetical protein
MGGDLMTRVQTYKEGALNGLQLGEQYYNFVYETI